MTRQSPAFESHVAADKPLFSAPIPKGAPRQRGCRACIACREAKRKCRLDADGSDSDDSSQSGHSPSKPCIRCAKLDIVCEFAPNRRFGRPRRLPPTPHPDGVESDSNQIVSRPSEKLAIKSSVLPPPFGTELLSTDSCYVALLNEFKYNVHPYIPVLPSNELELEMSIRHAPPLLLNAILSVTYPHETHVRFVPNINPVLSEIQAAAFLTLVYYGRGEKDDARIVLERGTRSLLAVQPIYSELQSSEGSLSPGTDSDSSDGSSPDLWRKIWRECWALEILLSCLTGINSFVLSQNAFQPTFSAYPSSDPETADQLFIQAISLLRECITMPLESGLVSMEKIMAISTIGSNILSLARQQWPVILSSTDSSQSKLVNAVKRERLLVSGVSAACSLIHLHTTSFASCLFQCGIDISVIPPATSLLLIQTASRTVFDFLRDVINHYSSLSFNRAIYEDPVPAIPINTGAISGTFPQHSPFFACTYLVAAHGTLMAMKHHRGMPISELSRAAVATDFQLAEWAIKKQSSRWSNHRQIAHEIRALLSNIQDKIPSTNTRQIAGVPEIDCR